MSGLDDLVRGTSSGKGGGLGDLLGSLAGSSSPEGGLDDIIGGLTGAGNSGSQTGGMGGLFGSLLPALGGMLAGGGLQQVLSGFEANGLSAQADSWVGTGANQPISGEDVRKAVGNDDLAKIAAQLGVSEDAAADAVAQILPTVVDSVSPEGHLPPDSELESAFGELEKRGEGTPATG
ncbi:MAG: YidB family protein [Thermoleophilia bacterium]